MRSPMSARKLLLVALLVASNLAFANHAAMHANTNVAGCNWCVCQGHTPSAPQPVIELVRLERKIELAPVPVTSAHVSDPVSCSRQPRAPPTVS